MKKFLAVLVLTFALGALAFAAAPAVAGKAPTGPTPSITIDQATPHYGDTVTFTSVYDPHLATGNNRVKVRLFCDATPVTYTVLASSAATRGVVLGWEGWTGGPAVCHADLIAYRYATGVESFLATTGDFSVSG